MNRTALPGVVLGAALAVAGLAACNISSSSGSKGTGTSNDVLQHAEDVKIVGCAPENGWAAASVVITNHSSKPSDYTVTIAFNGTDGTQVGTALVSVDHLLPGQSSSPQDANSVQDAAPGSYTCTVSDAIRFAS